MREAGGIERLWPRVMMSKADHACQSGRLDVQTSGVWDTFTSKDITRICEVIQCIMYAEDWGRPSDAFEKQKPLDSLFSTAT